MPVSPVRSWWVASAVKPRSDSSIRSTRLALSRSERAIASISLDPRRLRGAAALKSPSPTRAALPGESLQGSRQLAGLDAREQCSRPDRRERDDGEPGDHDVPGSSPPSASRTTSSTGIVSTDDHDDHDGDRRQDESAAHGVSSSSTMRPTMRSTTGRSDRTGIRRRGRSRSSRADRCRRGSCVAASRCGCRACGSNPTSSRPTPALMMCSRLSVTPGWRISSSSRSNSLVVSSISDATAAVGHEASSRHRCRVRSRRREAARSAGGCRVVDDAQAGPDAGDEFGEPERFGDVVVGAGVEPDDDVHLLGACGQHDDREIRDRWRESCDTRRARRCRAGSGRAGRGRGEHQRRCRSRLMPPSTCCDLEALGPQHTDQRFADALVVLDQQARPCSCGRPRCRQVREASIPSAHHRHRRVAT